MSDSINPTERAPARAILLIAKSAFAASPHMEMQRLSDLLATARPADIVRFAFTEQGTPSLREALHDLLALDPGHITIVPLVLPMEPGFHNWLTKSLKRWQASDSHNWPAVSIAGDIASSPLMLSLMNGLLYGTASADIAPNKPYRPEGSLVPPQKYRVLVCAGGACHNAGADVIWNHLRNQQERQKLRLTGDGTMTARSTCLGPCNLAPVLQVFPEGTYYGGVTEDAVDRIISGHLLRGEVIEDYAYHPTGRKQRLRISQN